LKIRILAGVVIFILAVCVILLTVIYGFRVVADTDWKATAATPLSISGPGPGSSVLPSATAPPTCPPATLNPLRPSSLTGHHRVTLSWIASADSADPAKQVIGYCLYRSTKQQAAKQNPTCIDCEQINTIPVVGTGCVDDLVKDGTTYYYVVTAINAQREISSSSNETPAQIPLGRQPARTPSGSYSLCRAARAPN